MDLLDRINSLTDDQLRMVAERDDASGVLASYRLAEIRGLPYPDRSVVVLGDEYAIIARDGSIERVDIERGVTKIIRQEGDNYCVYSEDGSRSFGCYPTMGEAEERLRQIHYFREAEGDFVRLPDGRVGRIWHIMRDGTAEIPAGPTITATQEDPAALVVIYEQTPDGWRETETVSGAPLADLQPVERLGKAKVSVGDHVLYAVPEAAGADNVRSRHRRSGRDGRIRDPAGHERDRGGHPRRPGRRDHRVGRHGGGLSGDRQARRPPVLRPPRVQRAAGEGVRESDGDAAGQG